MRATVALVLTLFLLFARAGVSRADPVTEAYTRGAALMTQGNYAEASKVLEAGLAAWTPGSPYAKGALESQLASCYQILGQYGPAIKAARAALDEANRSGNLMTAYGAAVGLAYLDLTFGYDEEAVKVTQEITARVDAAAGSTDPSIAAVIGFVRPAAHFQLALAYEYLGDYAKTLSEMTTALDLAKQTKDAHWIAADTLWLGMYYSLSDDPKAITYLEEAKTAVEAEPPALAGGDKILVRRLLAEAYAAAGRPANAAAAYQEALAVAAPDTNPELVAALLVSQGGFLTSRHDEGASATLTRALTVIDAALPGIASPYSRAHLLQLKAAALTLLGRDQDALAAAQEALVQVRRLGQVEMQVQRLYEIGRLQERLDHPADAVAAYEAAVGLIETERSRITVKDERTAFLGRSQKDFLGTNRLQVYYRLIRLLNRLHRTEDAFAYVERVKARAFLDLLGTRRLPAPSNVPKALAERSRDLEAQITALTTTVGAESGKAATADRSAFVQDAEQRLDALKTAYAAVLGDIQAASPEYGQLLTVQPVALTAVQRDLGPDTVLLEYLLDGEHSDLWIVDSAGITYAPLTLSGDEAAALVRKARTELTRPKGAAASNRLNATLAKLYEALIAPAEAHLAGKRRIVIVPHGPLHLLPFACLRNPAGRYLVDGAAVLVAPSASVLHLARGKARHNLDRLTAGALGDYSPPLAGGLPTEPLPGAAAEVAAIAPLFPRATLLEAKDLTQARLLAALPGAAVVHLATHGVFDEDHPLFSGVVLADGFLTLHEAAALHLAADLVTLSACQTGLGAVDRGEEVVGLTRAFMYAGTPTVVASLWSVSDESTALLMKEFYRALLAQGSGSMDKAEALRQAQLAVMARYPHPFFWAPFFVTGDWR